MENSCLQRGGGANGIITPLKTSQVSVNIDCAWFMESVGHLNKYSSQD
jgi:hypothetical protein